MLTQNHISIQRRNSSPKIPSMLSSLLARLRVLQRRAYLIPLASVVVTGVLFAAHDRLSRRRRLPARRADGSVDRVGGIITDALSIKIRSTPRRGSCYRAGSDSRQELQGLLERIGDQKENESAMVIVQKQIDLLNLKSSLKRQPYATWYLNEPSPKDRLAIIENVDDLGLNPTQIGIHQNKCNEIRKIIGEIESFTGGRPSFVHPRAREIYAVFESEYRAVVERDCKKCYDGKTSALFPIPEWKLSRETTNDITARIKKLIVEELPQWVSQQPYTTVEMDQMDPVSACFCQANDILAHYGAGGDQMAGANDFGLQDENIILNLMDANNAYVKKNFETAQVVNSINKYFTESDIKDSLAIENCRKHFQCWAYKHLYAHEGRFRDRLAKYPNDVEKYKQAKAWERSVNPDDEDDEDEKEVKVREEMLEILSKGEPVLPTTTTLFNEANETFVGEDTRKNKIRLEVLPNGVDALKKIIQTENPMLYDLIKDQDLYKWWNVDVLNFTYEQTMEFVAPKANEDESVDAKEETPASVETIDLQPLHIEKGTEYSATDTDTDLVAV